ncbi:aa3-type cytochrome oxidase subunit IV [Streptomyces sp. NPDC004838]
MKAEAWLFTGTALFFVVVATIYGVFAHEPAGLSALVVSFIMSGLISAFLWWQSSRTPRRPEDRSDARIHETGDRQFFFPRPDSYAPVLTAAGAVLLGLGVAEGLLWIFLVGFGFLVPGVFAFVFGGRDDSD